MSKPVAGVEIGLVEGVLTVNPTKAEMAKSSLQLTVAGTKDGILMIEGAADFLPEEMMVEALKLGEEKWRCRMVHLIF
jgi:polyribonucleotide nucleotidyltransferase